MSESAADHKKQVRLEAARLERALWKELPRDQERLIEALKASSPTGRALDVLASLSVDWAEDSLGSSRRLGLRAPFRGLDPTNADGEAWRLYESLAGSIADLELRLAGLADRSRPWPGDPLATLISSRGGLYGPGGLGAYPPGFTLERLRADLRAMRERAENAITRAKRRGSPGKPHDEALADLVGKVLESRGLPSRALFQPLLRAMTGRGETAEGRRTRVAARASAAKRKAAKRGSRT